MLKTLGRITTTVFYNLSVEEKGQHLFGNKRVPIRGGMAVLDLEQAAKLEQAMAASRSLSDSETPSTRSSFSAKAGSHSDGEERTSQATTSVFPPAPERPPLPPPPPLHLDPIDPVDKPPSQPASTESPPEKQSGRCCLCSCLCAIWKFFLCIFTFGMCGRD